MNRHFPHCSGENYPTTAHYDNSLSVDQYCTTSHWTAIKHPSILCAQHASHTNVQHLSTNVAAGRTPLSRGIHTSPATITDRARIDKYPFHEQIYATERSTFHRAHRSLQQDFCVHDAVSCSRQCLPRPAIPALSTRRAQFEASENCYTQTKEEY